MTVCVWCRAKLRSVVCQSGHIARRLCALMARAIATAVLTARCALAARLIATLFTRYAIVARIGACLGLCFRALVGLCFVSR